MSIINVNSPSNLLTAEENETVFTIVGHRKQVSKLYIKRMILFSLKLGDYQCLLKKLYNSLYTIALPP